MTVSADTNKVQYSCNGVLDDFSFAFKVFSEDDLLVVLTDSDGVETTLVLTTDYTVTGENGAFDSGGYISTVKEVAGEMVDYAWASGYTITIMLDLALTQATDLTYGGKYSSAAIERMADKLTKMVQQTDEKLSRVPSLAQGSALSDITMEDPTSGYFLSYNGTVYLWVQNVSTGTATVTAFAKTFLDDVNASAVLSTLGLSTYIKTLVDDATAYNARKTLLTPMSRVLTTAKTGAYTVTSDDDGMLVTVDATANNIAITLPAVGDVWNGFTVGIKKIDSSANYVESTPDGVEEIDGESSHILRLENSIAWYVVDGTGWKIATNNEITGAMCVAALKDPAAGTAGLRTLGTGAAQALPGNTTLVPDASITQAKLKTTTHEQSTTATIWTKKVLTYADYGFNCRVKRVGGTGGVYFKRSDETNITASVSTSYVGESVWIKGYNGNTAYVIYRYVTSSGEVFWVWLLRDKATGKITDADCCSDHCGWGLDDPNDRPHPFKNYDPEKHEILLFNPTAAELTEILAKKTKKRSVLQIVLEDYVPEETTKRAWPSIPVTFDIEDDNWEEKLFTGKEAKIRQAVIKQVPYVKTVGMKRRK